MSTFIKSNQINSDQALQLKHYLLLLVIMTLTACTSYRDINTEGQSFWLGGYTNKKLDEGLFKITVESGTAPIVYKIKVFNMWNRRAKELCDESYQAIYFNVKAISPTFTNNGYVITRATGYAKCNSFNGDLAKAKQIIQLPESVVASKLIIQNEQLTSSTDGGCNFNTMPLEKLEQKGDAFYQVRNYKDAMVCFLSVYKLDKKSLNKKHVYQRIGLMYELGYGVEKNIAKARRWYKLAGLI